MRHIKDIPYGKEERNLLDIALPEGEGPFPAAVFFHGGGLTGGDKEELRGLAEEFCAAGVALISPNYRLYPTAAYPDFVEDAAAAVEWAAKEAGERFPLRKFFIGGYSAGCYLAMMLLLDKQWLAARGLDPDDFAGFLLLSGQPTKHFEVLARAGEDSRKIVIDETAPLYHVRSSGPPLLIMVSDEDIPNRLAQNRLLESTLAHYEYESPVIFKVMRGPRHGDFLHDNGAGHSWFGGEALPFIGKYGK
ncbi:MAG: alpha/beta hydrolase [Christensenellales bacterium]|jgi:acetyl esterase/lipase